ncbi:hypothetical protein ACROYT_G005105 [Oculina patagonica]
MALQGWTLCVIRIAPKASRSLPVKSEERGYVERCPEKPSFHETGWTFSAIHQKTELFDFLTTKVATYTFPQGKSVYITAGESVVAVPSTNPMPNCNHEEADTIIVVHVLHALQQGCKTVQVRTVDTDVVVVLVGAIHKVLQSHPLADIWIAFGVGKSYKLHSVDAIYNILGASKSKALLMFHALCGCDTTSSFRGKGKRSFWQAWLAFEEMPPTENALLQHTKRALYQASIWTTCTDAQQDIPSPAEFAWTKVGSAWVPVWLTVVELSKACRELIKCSCKGDCSSFKCGKAQLKCSPLCKCKCNLHGGSQNK